MAVDLLVMSLARFVSADYTTAAMEAAWAAGLDYYVVRPDGATRSAPGEPIGGPGAPAQRLRYVAEAGSLFAALRRYATDSPWDEANDLPIERWRPDSHGFEQLRDALPPHAHLRARALFPVQLARVLHMSFGTAGSLVQAEVELAGVAPDPQFGDAHRVLAEAICAARRRRLPLFLDD
jgi:hypothetical protein